MADDDEIGTLQRRRTMQYEYKPLARDEIRLLEIRPGMEWDEVCCRVKQFKVDRAPDYAAISYRWGVTDDRMSVRLDYSQLDLMPNAYWALYHQRRLKKYRYIWMDCLCINQANIVERSEQVMEMCRIYSRAKEVFVWLGLADEVMPPSFTALFGAVFTTDTPDRYSRLIQVLPIFGFDYWERIWIVQEVLSAAKLSLMCGELIASWDCLVTLVINVSMCSDVIDQIETNIRNSYLQGDTSMQIQRLKTNVVSLVEIRNSAQSQRLLTSGAFSHFGQGGGIYNFSDLLEKYSACQCGDVRDKVFALAQTWNLQAEIPFQVDYSWTINDLLIISYDYLAKDQTTTWPRFSRAVQRSLKVSSAAKECRAILASKLEFDERTGTTKYSLESGKSVKVTHFRMKTYEEQSQDVLTVVHVMDRHDHLQNRSAFKAWRVSMNIPSNEDLTTREEYDAYWEYLYNGLLDMSRLMSDRSAEDEMWEAGNGKETSCAANPLLYVDNHDHIGLTCSSTKVGDLLVPRGLLVPGGEVHQRLVQSRTTKRILGRAMDLTKSYKFTKRTHELRGGPDLVELEPWSALVLSSNQMSWMMDTKENDFVSRKRKTPPA